MTDRPTVGVVGDEGSIADAVEAAGATPVTRPAAEVVDDSDYIVAVGEAALLATMRASPSVPVLPVEAGRGVRSVPRDRVESAVASLLAGEFDREHHPVYDVAVADRTEARIFLDCLLVTAEPAQISEYAVRADGERVAQFRADGVVVATPAGSAGYARRAGGPVVPPETDALVVVPIAPFATDADRWVVPAGDVELSVERDVTAVDLVVDERVAGAVPPADPVRLSAGGSVAVAVVDVSQSPFPPL